MIAVAAIIVAHNAAAGRGVDLIIGVVMFGGQGAESLLRVGRDPQFVGGAGVLAGGIAVTDRVGIADKFDLARAGRRGRQGRRRLGDEETGEVRLVALRFAELFQPHGVLAGRQRPELDIAAARFLLLVSQLAVNIDLDMVDGVVEADRDGRTVEVRFVIHAGPLRKHTLAVDIRHGAAADMHGQLHRGRGRCRCLCLRGSSQQGKEKAGRENPHCPFHMSGCWSIQVTRASAIFLSSSVLRCQSQPVLA